MERDCETCKHRHISAYVYPCNECIDDMWEPCTPNAALRETYAKGKAMISGETVDYAALGRELAQALDAISGLFDGKGYLFCSGDHQIETVDKTRAVITKARAAGLLDEVR